MFALLSPSYIIVAQRQSLPHPSFLTQQGMAISNDDYWASQVVLEVKNLPANEGDIRDMDLIPGSGRPPGRGNGNPLQYSCLENSWTEDPWQVTVHRVAELDTTEET